MKRNDFFAATFRCATLTVTLIAAGATSASAQTLVGHWKMDEGSGTTITDASGTGNNGTLFGNATWAAGKDALALSLAGTDTPVDYAKVPDNASLDITGPITISA